MDVSTDADETLVSLLHELRAYNVTDIAELEKLLELDKVLGLRIPPFPCHFVVENAITLGGISLTRI
eukprot:625542-Prorocentrum_minimum.AAC.2